MRTLLFCLLLTSVSEAGVVLIPTSHAAFETYHNSCRRPDYKCSFDYMTQILSEKPTPNFDSLFDQLDLGSRSSMDSFRNRLIHILNTEEISHLQLQMLLEVLEEMNRIQPTVYFAMIEGELRRLHRLLERPARINPAKFVFIFKRRFPFSETAALKTTILKIPFYVLHYSSLPVKANTGEAVKPDLTPLSGGECGRETLTMPLERTRWKIQSSCESKTIKAAAFENKPEPHRALRHTQ